MQPAFTHARDGFSRMYEWTYSASYIRVRDVCRGETKHSIIDDNRKLNADVEVIRVSS
jgi:hypothetical protein